MHLAHLASSFYRTISKKVALLQTQSSLKNQKWVMQSSLPPIMALESWAMMRTIWSRTARSTWELTRWSTSTSSKMEKLLHLYWTTPVSTSLILSKTNPLLSGNRRKRFLGGTSTHVITTTCHSSFTGTRLPLIFGTWGLLSRIHSSKNITIPQCTRTRSSCTERKLSSSSFTCGKQGKIFNYFIRICSDSQLLAFLSLN